MRYVEQVIGFDKVLGGEFLSIQHFGLRGSAAHGSTNVAKRERALAHRQLDTISCAPFFEDAASLLLYGFYSCSRSRLYQVARHPV